MFFKTIECTLDKVFETMFYYLEGGWFTICLLMFMHGGKDKAHSRNSWMTTKQNSKDQ